MSISKDRIEILKNFAEEINIPFKNLELLNTALTHASALNDRLFSYERLEFLGDSVLKITISDYLFHKYPDYEEGQLTKIRAEIVSDNTIANFARKIRLDNLIILGKNEMQDGGREKSSILACVFEAVLGVIYLEFKEKNPTETVKNFMLKNFSDEIENIEENIDTLNPKAILQEYTQSQNKDLPKYVLLEETGAAHEKTFKMGVYYNNELIGTGIGKSKKEAQKACAKNAIAALGLLEEEKC
jgi:ribonuclease-3